MDKTAILVLCLNVILFHECLGQFQLIFGTPTAAPGAGGFDPNCKDKLTNCYAFPEENCHAPYEQWARDYCALTCKYCVGPTTPAPPCQDELSNCDAYADSVCTDPLYKAWANNKCRRRCRLCSAAELARLDALTTTIPPSKCVDKVDCRLYGNDACSGSFEDWSHDNCPNYCGYCSGVPTPPPVCKDKIPNCGAYGTTVCTTKDYDLWVEDNCRKYCGRCGSSPLGHAVRPGGGGGNKIPTPIPVAVPGVPTLPFLVPTPPRGAPAVASISYAPFTPPAPGKREEPSVRDKRQFQANHHHGSHGHGCWDRKSGKFNTDDPFCQTMAPSTNPTVSGGTDSNQSFNTNFPGHDIKPNPTAPDGWDSKGSQSTKRTDDNKTSRSTATISVNTTVTASVNVTSAPQNVTSAPQTSSTDTAVVFPSGGPPTGIVANGTTFVVPATGTSRHTPKFLGSTSSPGTTEAASNTTAVTLSNTTTSLGENTTTLSSPISTASVSLGTPKPTGSSTKNATSIIVTKPSSPPAMSVSTSTLANTMSTSAGTTGAPCLDLLGDKCRTYDPEVSCKGLYKPWARHNCAAFCGFCIPKTSPRPCVDAVPNCNEFDDGTLCTAKRLRLWAEDKCFSYCGFGNCVARYTSPATTTTKSGVPPVSDTKPTAVVTISSTMASTTTEKENCTDALSTCDYFPDRSCFGIYTGWARANCKKRCGFCISDEPCVDRNPYCDKYEPEICTDANFTGWARYNCKHHCNMCAPPTHTPATTDITGTGPTLASQTPGTLVYSATPSIRTPDRLPTKVTTNPVVPTKMTPSREAVPTKMSTTQGPVQTKMSTTHGAVPTKMATTHGAVPTKITTDTTIVAAPPTMAPTITSKPPPAMPAPKSTTVQAPPKVFTKSTIGGVPPKLTPTKGTTKSIRSPPPLHPGSR